MEDKKVSKEMREHLLMRLKEIFKHFKPENEMQRIIYLLLTNIQEYCYHSGGIYDTTGVKIHLHFEKIIYLCELEKLEKLKKEMEFCNKLLNI